MSSPTELHLHKTYTKVIDAMEAMEYDQKCLDNSDNNTKQKASFNYFKTLLVDLNEANEQAKNASKDLPGYDSDDYELASKYRLEEWKDEE